MRPAVLDWLATNANPEDWQHKRVLDVGARDVNGNPRAWLEKRWDCRYVGVDAEDGDNVNVVVPAEQLGWIYQPGEFDCVICLDTLEHMEHWQAGLIQMKRVLRTGGVLFLVAPRPGFIRHNYPDDFWRFTPEVLQAALIDFEVEAVDEETVAVLARKPLPWREIDLLGVQAEAVPGA